MRRDKSLLCWVCVTMALSTIVRPEKHYLRKRWEIEANQGEIVGNFPRARWLEELPMTYLSSSGQNSSESSGKNFRAIAKDDAISVAEQKDGKIFFQKKLWKFIQSLPLKARGMRCKGFWIWTQTRSMTMRCESWFDLSLWHDWLATHFALYFLYGNKERVLWECLKYDLEKFIYWRSESDRMCRKHSSSKAAPKTKPAKRWKEFLNKLPKQPSQPAAIHY